MKVLVTGGGGFLGFEIVKQLISVGHDVVSYSRHKHDKLNDLEVLQFEGSLEQKGLLRKAISGCEAVFHVAAKTGIKGSKEEFFNTNVIGTKNILDLCTETGIKYMVFTSSASVIYSGGSEGKNEELPYPEKFDAPYPETKAIAEKMVLESNTANLITCALRPHLVWGPGDPHFFPRLVQKAKNGKLKILGDGEYHVDTTYVADAAKAHIQVLNMMLEQPSRVAGKAYFLSQDEPITIKEFINRLIGTAGLSPISKSINPNLARFAGRILEFIYKSFRIKSEPPVTLFIAKQLSSSHWYDISAAKEDFNYKPSISISEGMKNLKAWVDSETL